MPPAPDGSRPGTFYVNLADPSEKIVLFVPSDLSGSIGALLGEREKG